MANVDFYLNKAKENDKTIGVNSAKTNKVDYYLNKAKQIDNQNKYLQMLQNDADAQANSMAQPTRAEYDYIKLGKKAAADQAAADAQANSMAQPTRAEYNAQKLRKQAADQANTDAQENSRTDIASSLKHRENLINENSQLTLQAQKLARSGVNTEQVNEINNKIKSNNQTIQRINEWEQEQKTKRNITTENANTWLDSAKVLSEKPVWDENDKVIAGEMLSALGGKDALERAGKSIKAFSGNNYLTEIKGKDDYAGMLEVQNIYNNLYARYHEKASAAAAGLYKGMGAESAMKLASAITNNEFLDKAVEDYSRKAQIYQSNAPKAYAAGSVAGNIALMEGIASGIAAIPGFANVPAIAQATISGAGTFGLSSAVQQAGSAATGEESWGDFVKNVMTSAASGAAGGTASGVLGMAGLNILKKHNLTTNKIARMAVAGVAASGYSASSTAVSETAAYITDKENYKFDYDAAVERILVGFAFGAIGALTKNYTTDANTAAQIDYDDQLAEKYFGGMSQKEALKAYRTFAKEYSDVLNFTGGIENMSPEMAARYNTLQDINRAYDRFIVISGTRAYNKAQEAKASGDAEAYAASSEEFKDAIKAIKDVSTNGVNQESIDILEAVHSDMAIQNVQTPAEAIPQSVIPAAAAQAAVPETTDIKPSGIMLPTAKSETTLPRAQQYTSEVDAAPAVMDETVKLQNAYKYLLANSGETATQKQVDAALQIANRAKELSNAADGETRQQLEVIDQVMTKYADYYGKKTLPASASNSNIVLPTAENPTLPEGVNENGRNDILNGSGEWDVSQRSGEQIRRMAESTGESAAINQAARSLEVKNIARHLRAGRVSSIDLGVGEKYGTETKKTYLIPEENWTEWMREADAKTFAETGKHVEYTSGLIEIRGDDGQIRLTRGVRTDEKYIIQADHLKYTIEQLIIHERHHDDSINNPGLNDAIKEQIIDKFTREEYDKVLDKYLEGLNGLYSATDVSEDLAAEKQSEAIATIEDEMFADARAGMNSFAAGAVKFEEAANEAANDYIGGSVRKENAAAISNKNGPPTRFSSDDQPKKIELPVIHAKEENINGRESRNNTETDRRALPTLESNNAGRAIFRGRTDANSNTNNVSSIPRFGETTERQQRRIISIYANKLDTDLGKALEREYGLTGFIAKVYDSIIDNNAFAQNAFKYFPGLEDAAKQVLDYITHESSQAVKPVDIESSNKILKADKDSNGNVLSNEQRKYFANAATLDKNGNLYVLYHGSVSKLFTIPDMYEGIWLTPDRSYAENYAEFWDSEKENAGESDIYSDPELRLYEFYANIQKPYDLGEINGLLKTDYVLDIANRIGANEDTFIKLSDLSDRFKGENTYNLVRSHDFITIIREAGYDGMMATENGIKTFCAISSPNQVKLTSNKTPTNNADIRFSIEDSDGNELTEGQQEYFKDSKVRDENGNLLVVYHGSSEDFTVFDKTRGRSSMDIQGMFFSPWELDAQGYGENVRAFYLNIVNPASESAGYKALNMFKGQNNAGVKAREYLERLGYDGVNNGDEEYIAFNSKQIKTIDNINPTKNDDIRFSLEDETKKITLPTADERLQKKKDNKKLSEEKRKEYLENRIAMLSDLDYQKSLLDRGGATAVKTNDTEIKKLQTQLDKINGIKPVPKQPREQPKITPSQPTQARAELRKTLLNTFSIPNGLKTETAKTIDNIADRILKQGYIGIDEQKQLFNLLYDSGVVTVDPPQEYSEAYAQMKNAHIYVSPEVKAEFIDSEYNDLRKRAFAAGIYLTNNSSNAGVDSWNMWLAEELPGFFSENDTDMRGMLENIVQTAEEGKAENMSLADYAAYMYKTEGIPEDQMLDSLTRQLDYALDKFADKAKFEVKLKDRTRSETAKLKAEIKAMQKKQSETKAIKELQQKTLKQLQWLSKNKMKAPTDLKAQFEDVLSDIDILAVSAANEMNWSNKYQATWKDIRDMYQRARESDPNFLPSKEIEDIISRLDNRKISEMDVDELQKLYKAALGLRTEFYNRNNVLMDDKHRLFSDVYEDAKEEIGNAKGKDSDNKLNYFINYEQLTPMNVLSRMGGWNKNGAWQSMAKQLEEGEVKAKKYFTDGKKYLSEFMKDNDEWFRKADGQGKDGIWYEYEVPQLLELKMGDKPIFGDTIKVYMTPMQKIHMYLESKNFDNLRHMAGGRTFADKKLYSKGERTEAFAHGRTIKLAPESVRKIVSDLTEEEKELADLLEKFYNDISSKEINKVSNVLVGYDKAVNKNYAPIFTNKSYTNSEFGKFDVTAEGVGNLKARQVSANPSLNISAIDAFDKHIDQTSRYIGYAIPVRNWNTLMNWRGKSDSMKSVIEAKWGKKGISYIDDIINTLQAGKMADRSVIDKMMSGLLSKYVTATFGFNPGIVFKQAASYPQAASVLGWQNVPAPGRRFGVDTELIYKYTPELDYRTLGYATPETAVLKENPNKLSTNKAMRFTFGGDAIIAMDAATVKRLWPWAENYVHRNYPDLEMGTQEQIDNGESPFYKKVAEVFNDAVHTTQPMYDVMHRPTIMQHSGFTRAFTMFKTVPLSQQNINRQALGELAAAKQKAKEAKTDYEKAEAEKEHKKAANKAAATVTATIASIAMLEAIEFLNQLWKNGAKKYRDENGKFTFGSVTKRVLLGSASDAVGMMVGGQEFVEVLENIFLGEKWYGIDMPGGTQLNEFIEAITSAADTIEKIINDGTDVVQNGGNLGEYFHANGREYAGALKKIIENAATYIPGFPILNMEKYILGTIQHISPELYTEVNDYFKTPTKAGLKGVNADQARTMIMDIFDNRGIEISEDSAKALAALYADGLTDAIPTNIPSSFSVDGEDIKLGAYQQQKYGNTWNSIVSNSLDKLIKSSEFAKADNSEQEKMLSKLYKYAQEKAKEATISDYTSDEIKKIDEAIKAGASLVEYAAWSGLISDDDMKQSDKIDLLKKQRYSDKVKSALFGSMVGTDLKTDSGEPSKFAKFKDAVNSGLSANDSLTLYDEDLLDKYLKLIDEDYDSKTAYNAAMIIRDASEDIDKYRAIYESDANMEDAGAALKIVLNKYSYKADVAEDYNIDAKEFSEMKITLPKYDADGNGSYKQAEVKATLDSMNLTNDERAALWQIQTSSTSAKNNPYNRSIGQAVINALKVSKPE